MKTTKFVALVVLLVSAGAFLVAQAQEHPTKKEHPSETEQAAIDGNIFAVASAAGEFKTLCAAIEAAGLVKKLEGKGPYTIFAPTDEAFAKLPDGMMEDLLKPANKAKLAGFLANHVVPGTCMAADLKNMKAANVSGQDLDIQVGDSGVTVNNAHVVHADLVASNGVIHAIDTVIIMDTTQKKAASEKPKDHPAH
jgi:uncharacterized surface protein with fasciclin (FAS1) repeats